MVGFTKTDARTANYADGYRTGPPRPTRPSS